MKKTILFFSIFLVLIAFSQGAIEISDSYIDTEYIQGSFISGWIKMIIENEPITTIVTDTEKTILTLKDFLEKAGVNYECSTKECGVEYSSDGEITESFNLLAGEEKIFGLRYLADINEIVKISFDIVSDAEDSDYNQLKIDILNDGTYEAGNNKKSTEISYSVNSGCFTNEARQNPIEASIDNLPYCQRISVDESPGLGIGAWIKKVSGNNNIIMNLYGTNGIKLEGCSIPSSVIGTGSFVSCDVDYLTTEEKDYYVCMQKEGSEGDYLLRVNTLPGSSNICGLHNYPLLDNDNEVASYDIGVIQKKFGPVGTISVSNNLENGDTISNIVIEYIIDKYNSKCSNKNPCYVPIKISSEVNQNITINSVVSEYRATQYSAADNEVYGLSEKPSTLSLAATNMSIDTIFEINKEPGSREYEITIGAENLSFDEKINVKSGEFRLFPRIAISGEETKFNIISDINETMKSYSWDFKDNTTIEKTTSPSVIHTYEEIKTHTLSVTITDSNNNFITKLFNVTVSSSKDLVDSELSRMKSDLTEISSIIKLSLSEYEKNKLLENVNIELLLENVNSIESALGENPTAEEYRVAFEEISLLNVPTELIRTDFKSVPFFPLKSEINTDVIRDITQELESASNSGITDAILLWSKNSMKVSIKESEMTLRWENEKELLLKTFKLDLTPRIPIEEYYLIFDNTVLSLDSADVVESINQKSYIKIPGNKKSINIFSSADVSFSKLPIVVSPRISDLSIIDLDFKEADAPFNKALWLFVGILFAILLGFIIYFALKYWYRTKYERHLFKDRNSLYNVMLYVNKSIAAAVPINEIRQSLKKSGWSSEQIRYILRKYEGRETGMPGFGVKKINAQKEVKNTNQNMFKDRKYKP